MVHHLVGKGMMLEPWAQSLPAPVLALVRGGYLAVGTFFVLSGFVLARSYASKTWTRNALVKYGAARIARIYPTYLLSLVIIAPFIFDWCFPSGRVPPPPSQQAEQLVNYGLVLQGWAGKPAVFWNTPAWSLSCELFFYLCFPLVIVCLGVHTWPRILAALAGCLVLPTLLIYAGIPAPWKPIHHMADFLLGIVAAGLYDWVVRSQAIRHGFWLYAPATAIGLVVVAFPALVERWMTLNGALRPVNAALLVGLAIGGGFPARALSTNLVTYLGKASYSMYILHIPLLWWFKRSWMYRSALLSQSAYALVYLTGVILICSATCRWIEEPANQRIRNLFTGLWIPTRPSSPQV